MNPFTRISPALVPLPVLVFLTTPVGAQTPVYKPSVPFANISLDSSGISPGARPWVLSSYSTPDTSQSDDPTSVFIIRQTQLHGGATADAYPNGNVILAPLPIDPVGSRFVIIRILSHGSPRTQIMASTTVGLFIPIASVAIRTEDPYAVLPRTRADRPFQVDVAVQGLRSDASYPEVARSITFTHHAQSYGTGVGGILIDRGQATQISQSSITTNGKQTLTYQVNSVPSDAGLKKRGEERFTAISQADTNPTYPIPPQQLAAGIVQIWPVADGSITGPQEDIVFEPGSIIPELTFTMNDLYPKSTTWAQVYRGAPRPGATGRTQTATRVTFNHTVPQNRVIKTKNYLNADLYDGLWTIEIVTDTPFGRDVVCARTFTLRNLVTPLEFWRGNNFSGNRQNSGDGADLNDHDKDGLPNLVEYAFALDPKVPSPGQLPQPQIVEGQRVITFTPPSSAEGVVHGVQWSSTLEEGSWTDIPNTGIPPEHTFVIPETEDGNVFTRFSVMPK